MLEAEVGSLNWSELEGKIETAMPPEPVLGW